MKNIYIAIFTFFAATNATLSIAASVIVKGQVEFVRTHDASAQPAWAPPRFWFSLKGVSSAIGCQTWGNSSVLMVGNDRQALTLILAAQAGGQEVAVYLDNSQLVNNYCLATFITVGNPAPLY